MDREPSAAGPEALQEGFLARLQVAAVEEADLDPVVEEHPVAAPGEAIGEEDSALSPGRHFGQIDLGPHPLARREIDLGRQVTRQLVLVPNNHGRAS